MLFPADVEPVWQCPDYAVFCFPWDRLTLMLSAAVSAGVGLIRANLLNHFIRRHALHTLGEALGGVWVTETAGGCGTRGEACDPAGAQCRPERCRPVTADAQSDCIPRQR